MNRGLGSRLAQLQDITIDASIEDCLERTLRTVEEALGTFHVHLSLDWLQEKKLKDKLLFDLHRVTNCNQLIENLQYCLKTIFVVETIALDMSVDLFEEWTDSLREEISRMISFITSLYDIQSLWIRTFAFVKFSPESELDRDATRLYQSCTEDMKKIVFSFQSSTGFHSAFKKISCLDIGTSGMQTILVGLAEDMHANIESMLNTCPRLSLLSYDKLTILFKIWMVDPCQYLDFISSCIQDMFLVSE